MGNSSFDEGDVAAPSWAVQSVLSSARATATAGGSCHTRERFEQSRHGGLRGVADLFRSVGRKRRLLRVPNKRLVSGSQQLEERVRHAGEAQPEAAADVHPRLARLCPADLAGVVEHLPAQIVPGRSACISSAENPREETSAVKV